YTLAGCRDRELDHRNRSAESALAAGSSSTQLFTNLKVGKHCLFSFTLCFQHYSTVLRTLPSTYNTPPRELLGTMLLGLDTSIDQSDFLGNGAMFTVPKKANYQTGGHRRACAWDTATFYEEPDIIVSFNLLAYFLVKGTFVVGVGVWQDVKRYVHYLFLMLLTAE
ncbi:hypothetical protein CVT26_003276, partial [Gymnopilus dilepis]